jgi:hypothetical protein
MKFAPVHSFAISEPYRSDIRSMRESSLPELASSGLIEAGGTPALPLVEGIAALEALPLVEGIAALERFRLWKESQPLEALPLVEESLAACCAV